MSLVERRARIGVALVVALTVLVAGLSIASIERLIEAARWVDHTHRVLHGLDDLRYQRAYAAGSARRDVLLLEIQTLTADNAAQQSRVEALRALDSGSPPLPAIERADPGASLLDALVSEERRLLGARNSTEEAQAGRAIAAISTTGALVIILAIGAALLVRRAVAAAAAADLDRRLFFSLSRELMCVGRPGGFFDDVNGAWETVLGWTRDELLARPILELIHPEDVERTREIQKQLQRGLPMVGFENRYRAKDGSYRTLLWNGVPNGIKRYSVARDVTAIREQERALASVTASLAFSNRELDGFAGVASHDLQEPLRKVIAFGERLKTRHGAALGTEGNDYVDRMRAAAARMQQLIDDLLAYSRVTASRAEPIDVDLGKIAREVVVDLEVAISESGGRVEIGALATVKARPLQMRQLLQNLIGNALKFRAPHVSPVITLATTSTGAGVTLTVADNGIGFDEKYLDLIFGAFQRLHGRSEYPGNGVGLAICRRIAEQNGGRITATSKIGEGATFIVELPA